MIEPVVNKEKILVRTRIAPGDREAIVALHGRIYACEWGFDHTFEDYVAGPLAEFLKEPLAEERIWVVERVGVVVGSVAVVQAEGNRAQLRWLLLDPDLRGIGLGKKLVGAAVSFARSKGYQSMFLLTVDCLEKAAAIYRSFGFTVTEQSRLKLWGLELTEQKYELVLQKKGGARR